jgi:antitoxin (DNA-binding transcriptional repressor) of toxin-antitoxin stability system
MVEFIQVGNEVQVTKDGLHIGRIIPIKKGKKYIYQNVPVNGTITEWSSMKVAQGWYDR